MNYLDLARAVLNLGEGSVARTMRTAKGAGRPGAEEDLGHVRDILICFDDSEIWEGSAEQGWHRSAHKGSDLIMKSSGASYMKKVNANAYSGIFLERCTNDEDGPANKLAMGR